MINSKEYLLQAFSEEYLARKRYQAFAGQAEKEGYPEIAKLFRNAAQGKREDLMALHSGKWDS